LHRHVIQLLGELDEKHIYFKPQYLQWFWRKVRENVEPWMAEEMRRLPDQLALCQKQAQTFLKNILDIDRVGRYVQQNTRENYTFDGTPVQKLQQILSAGSTSGILRGSRREGFLRRISLPGASRLRQRRRNATQRRFRRMSLTFD